MEKDQLPALSKHPEIGEFIETILSRMKDILGEKLAGLYLFGSLVMGDFDYEISDIDLLAATTVLIDENEFRRLDKMQNDLVETRPRWKNRLEISYLPLYALKTFKTQTSRAAVISPGEPFHFKESGNHWLIDWYMVREKGLKIFGPPPQEIIAPVSKEEFIRAVREQAMEWRDYVNRAEFSRPFQAYAILTICRAFYAVTNGEQASKKRAALWAQTRMPEWADLIEKAIKWRSEYRVQNVDHRATFPETKKFVHHVIKRITD